MQDSRLRVIHGPGHTYMCTLRDLNAEHFSMSVNQSYLTEIRDVVYLRFHRAKEAHGKGTSKLSWHFTNIRVAILPLPVPHTGPVILLFFCLEKTPHLRTHWGCFLKVSVWQGDRGHHSLPFLSFGKAGWNWKGGPQLPPWRPSLLQSSASRHPPPPPPPHRLGGLPR